MTMGGDMWFDGFASPWLADVLPQALGGWLIRHDRTVTPLRMPATA
jgi:hypothetical protein